MRTSAWLLLFALVLVVSVSGRKVSVSLTDNDHFSLESLKDTVNSNRRKREAAEWGQSTSWNKPKWDDTWEDKEEIVREADENEEGNAKSWMEENKIALYAVLGVVLSVLHIVCCYQLCVKGNLCICCCNPKEKAKEMGARYVAGMRYDRATGETYFDKVTAEEIEAGIAIKDEFAETAEGH